MKRKPNDAVCCISGIVIENPRDYSIDHWCPKSRISRELWQQPYNMRPALKIMNTIKGNLLPCEWDNVRCERTLHAIERWNISAHDRELARRALDNFARGIPADNPCYYCILRQQSPYCGR